jgi:hypothetical protein
VSATLLLILAGCTPATDSGQQSQHGDSAFTHAPTPTTPPVTTTTTETATAPDKDTSAPTRSTADTGRTTSLPTGSAAHTGLGTHTADTANPAGVWFVSETILPDLTWPAETANVRVAELALGPGPEVLVTEASNRLTAVYGCAPTCTVTEIPLPKGLVPVRPSAVDIDADGDLDVILANIGDLMPSDSLSGSVHLLRREGDSFVEETLLTDIYRTVCAEPGDLDGDGDLDLAICTFGNSNGHIRWLEASEIGWTDHIIDAIPGTIHLHPVDLDSDGDLDLAAVVSQLDESIVLYENDGSGRFWPHVLFQAADPWFGMSGLEVTDLDLDGDLDLLFTHGDTLDMDLPPGLDPASIHGVTWLENTPAGFEHHTLFNSWGAYNAKAADLDNDGDMDLVLASFQVHAVLAGVGDPLVWLENDGTMGFVAHPLPMAPANLLTLALADIDADGDTDILTGSMYSEGDGALGARAVLLRNQLIR